MDKASPACSKPGTRVALEYHQIPQPGVQVCVWLARARACASSCRPTPPLTQFAGACLGPCRQLSHAPGMAHLGKPTAHHRPRLVSKTAALRGAIRACSERLSQQALGMALSSKAGPHSQLHDLHLICHNPEEEHPSDGPSSHEHQLLGNRQVGQLLLHLVQSPVNFTLLQHSSQLRSIRGLRWTDAQDDGAAATCCVEVATSVLPQQGLARWALTPARASRRAGR